MKVGSKVYVKDFNVRGKIVGISKNGGIISVKTNDGVIHVAKRLVTLWELIGFFSRLIIKLFSKK